MTRSHCHLLLWGLLGALLAVAPGCAVEVADATSAACVQDSDCRAGLQCFESRLCVAAQVTPMPVVLHLKPAKDSGFTDEQFEVVVDGQSARQPAEILLSEPAVVRGKVLRAGDLVSASIPGTLMAVAPSLVPARPLTFSTGSGNLQVTADQPDAWGYELRVPSGHTYDLTFWPESQVIPPYYAKLVANASIAGWDILLPAEKSLVRVHGQLRWAGKGVGGVQLALEDAEGRVRSRQAVCAGSANSAESCTPQPASMADGSFDLLVDAGFLQSAKGPADKVFLRLHPATPDVPLPRGRLPLGPEARQLLTEAVWSAASPNAGKTAQVDLGEVPLGDAGAAIDVDVIVHGPDSAAVPGAWVKLVQQVEVPKPKGQGGGNVLQITVNGNADAKGVFHARMPPGPVKVSVSPLPKSTAGAKTLQAQVTGSAILVSCPPRVTVAGRVTDDRGRAMAGGQVSLHRLGSGEGDSDDANDAEVPMLVDAAGQFAGSVDAGSYAVWVEPGAASDLPRSFVRNVDLSGPHPPGLDLVLPVPVVFTGRIHGALGQPVPAVVVDVLTVQPAAPLRGQAAARKPEASGAVFDSHVLASTVANAAGRFSVLLAPNSTAPTP